MLPCVSYFVLVILYSLVFTSGLTGVNGDNVNKLKVQVYYETKCPDSAQFFRSQLYPSMVTNGRLNYTDLELIPFGKAFTFIDQKSNQLAVSCQHGEAECLDNALHACILETTEFTKAFETVSCLMSNLRRDLEICQTNTKLNLDPVDDCLADRSTADILVKYEKKTNQIPLTFVPSIAVDGIFRDSDQNDLLRRFDRTFCKAYNAKFKKQLPRCG